MRIVFFGTTWFAAQILEDLLGTQFDVKAIVTRVDKPKGRHLQMSPSVVKELALQKYPNIPLFQPLKASTVEFEETLRALKPDVFVVVAYGEIIKKNLLSLPSKGCVNIHPSLLPKYRGAAPIHHCLLNGDLLTGVCIISMIEALDAGDILAQETLCVELEDNFATLEEKLLAVAKKLLKKVLTEGRFQGESQDNLLATIAPKISSEMEKISWQESCQTLNNKIRAFSPRPGAYCHVKIGDELKRLKILRAKPFPALQGAPGSILSQKKDELLVACGTGSLGLLEVQPEGKKKLLIREFLQGLHKSLVFQ